jgi:hypothetical protein
MAELFDIHFSLVFLDLQQLVYIYSNRFLSAANENDC